MYKHVAQRKNRQFERYKICLPRIILCISLTGFGTSLSAQEDEAEPGTVGRVLGKINFPTSATSHEAQDAFIRGMLLLHLFEYPFARKEFIAAQEIEPEFAMAYWGEAMTYNHPVWDEQDLDAGRTALQKLAATPDQRQELTPAPKEQGLLAAIDLLYGSGQKKTRDRAYAQAMERMAAQYPEDHEIQLFYALSLFGIQAGVRDIPTYMMSTAIAQAVFSENRDHPGAAHYLIHGVDDPDHAVLGLAAARALAKMAPDAGHSLHMTSHIFTALGMWDDVVMANENAVAVQNSMRGEQGLAARHWGHYNFWLIYGYLQQGRVEKARELLVQAYAEAQADGKSPDDRMILDSDRSLLGSVVQMWSRYIIESRDWHGEIAEWKFNMGDSFDPNLNFTFIQSMRASQQGQAALATSYMEQFQKLKDELTEAIKIQDEPAPTDLLYLSRLAVLEQEMLAGIEYARGENSMAVKYAMEASRLEGEMPFSFGPPYVDWPAAEYLGETLLNARKYSEAIDAFDLQLKRARMRAHSLVGQTRAQARLGNEMEVRYSLEKIQLIWHGADAEVISELRKSIPGLNASRGGN